LNVSRIAFIAVFFCGVLSTGARYGVTVVVAGLLLLRSGADRIINATTTSPYPADPPPARQCRGLRSKRYLSDGFCQTLRPVSEVVCAGSCVLDPHEALRPGLVSSWGRASGGRAVEWRCVDAAVRRRRVRLVCENGSVRVYRVRVVLACACQQVPAAAAPARRRHRHRHVT